MLTTRDGGKIIRVAMHITPLGVDRREAIEWNRNGLGVGGPGEAAWLSPPRRKSAVLRARRLSEPAAQNAVGGVKCIAHSFDMQGCATRRQAERFARRQCD